MRIPHNDGSKDYWQTPPNLFNYLHEYFNFTLDGAATVENSLLPEFCTNFFTHEFKKSDVVYVNPPFSEISKGLWFKHAFEVSKLKGTIFVFLVPLRAETRAFHHYVWPDSPVFIFDKRIQYVNPHTKKIQNGTQFASCLVMFDQQSNLSSSQIIKILTLSNGTWISSIRME